MHGQTDNGKGDCPRPYSTKAWDRGYLRAHGKPCPLCNGVGCNKCSWIGYVTNEEHRKFSRRNDND